MWIDYNCNTPNGARSIISRSLITTINTIAMSNSIVPSNFTDLSKEFKTDEDGIELSTLRNLYFSQSLAIRVLPSPYDMMVDPYSLSGLVKKPLAAFSDSEMTYVRIIDKNLDIMRGFLSIDAFLARLGISSRDCGLCRSISRILSLKGLRANKVDAVEDCADMRKLECQAELAFAKSMGTSTGFIYLVELDGCLKMGYSTNPAERIKGYKTSSYKTNTIKIVEGNKTSEQYLHRFLYSCSEKYDKSREAELVEAMERIEFSHQLLSLALKKTCTGQYQLVLL